MADAETVLNLLKKKISLIIPQLKDYLQIRYKKVLDKLTKNLYNMFLRRELWLQNGNRPKPS